MKGFNAPTSAAAVVSLLWLLLFVPQPAWGQTQPASALPPRAIIFDHPLSFEENKGQAPADIRFLTHGDGYGLSLKPDEAVMTLSDPAHKATPSQVSFYLVGANPAASISGVAELPGRSNYFQGNDPAQWTTGVRQYGKVQFTQAYPGIDVIYYGKQHLVEHDFVVAPQADPNRIQIDVRGGTRVRLTATGDVEVVTAARTLTLRKPVLYQMEAGVRRDVTGSYELRGKNRLGFHVGTYDRTAPLIIDPTFTVNTPLGGNAFTETLGVASDSNGNIYATGFTLATNFTLRNAIQSVCAYSCANSDAFIIKLDPTGTTVLYSTYFGGSGVDQGLSISADPQGEAFVTGTTTSIDLPTKSPFQAHFTGSLDAFVLKLNADGTLGYSTYLGGSNSTGINNGYNGAIKADSQGNAYVTGPTNSSDFPVTDGVFQRTLKGNPNAYLSKFSPAGALVFSTYVGGTGSDGATGIDVDSSGNSYLTGTTSSASFPVTTGALSTTCAACSQSLPEVFVVKMNSTATAEIYATFLGDAGGSYATAIAANGDNAYVAGYTPSLHFPTTSGAYQNTCLGCASGQNSGFVSELNPAGTALVFSTYLGGHGDTRLTGIFVDANSNISVTGGSTAPDFPITSGAPQPLGGGGILVSSDGGKTFSRDNSGLQSATVRQVIADAANFNILYAATANGCFRSTDGLTWLPFSNGLPTAADVRSLVSTSTALYATVRTSPAGVYKYSFANSTWAIANSGLPTTLAQIDAIAVDPSNSSVLYVGTGGRTAQIYKSTSAAATWTAQGSGIPNTNTGFEDETTIAVDPTGIVYAGIIDPFGTSPGVYKSSSGGSSWTASNTGLNSTVINNLTIDPNNANTLYAATSFSFNQPTGIVKSTNAGVSWSTVLDLGGYTGLSVAVDPTNSSSIVAGTTAGALTSADAGNTWNTDLTTDLEKLFAQAVDYNGKILIFAGTSAETGSIDGSSSAVLTQFDPTGAQLTLSTFLGGPYFSTGTSIAPTALAPFGVIGGYSTIPPASINIGGTISGFDALNPVQGLLTGVGTLSPKLAITKTSPTTFPIAIGDTVTYSITVTNTGNEIAAGVKIFDTLPPNFYTTSIRASASLSGTAIVLNGQVECDLNSIGLSDYLAPGQSFTCTITAVAEYTGNFQNTASGQYLPLGASFPTVVSSSPLAGQIVNATPPVATPANVSVGTVQTGSSASQTTTLKNTGAFNYRPTSIVPSCGTSASCAISSDSCSAAAVAPGASCSFTTAVTCNSVGAVSGSLSISDNTATSPLVLNLAGTCVTPPPLTITKTLDNTAPIAEGDTVSFTIRVTNSSSQGMPATMNDPLPSNFDSVHASSSTGTCAVNNGTATCDAGNFSSLYSLPAGSSYTINVSATALTPGAFTDTASVLGGATASASGTINYSVPAVISPTSVSPGNIIIGTSASTKLTFTSPGAFNYRPLSIVPTCSSNASCSTVNDTCSGQTLSSGGACSLNVLTSCTSAGSLTGSLRVTDNSSASPVSVPISGACVSPAATSSSVTSSAASSPVGQSVTFTATVASPGAATPTGTVTFLDGTASLGTGTLNASGVATLSTSALTVGVHTINAQYAGDATHAVSSGSVQQTIVAIPPDFSITANPSSLTIKSGGSGTSMLTVTPVGGATGNILFACTTSAPDITCATVPSPIVLNGSNTPVTAVLTINTLVHSELNAPFANSVVLALLTPLWLLGWRRRMARHSTASRRLSLLMIAACALVLPLLSACGGSNNAGLSTPPGGYSLTVTAAGPSTHTVVLNVTVQ